MKLRRLLSLTFILIGGGAQCGRMAAEEPKPLKVFVLVGQSNMQGHAQIRTFAHIGMDPEMAPLLRQMQGTDGTPRVCEDVWISSLSDGGVKQGRLTAGFGADQNKIGPEFTFGITMRKLLGEPILLIKAAWGGKSLLTDFRPPGAGPYEFNGTQLETFAKQGKDVDAIKAEKVKATGHYYRLAMDHVKQVLADPGQVIPDYDPAQGFELAGFVWFQGWNDMVDGGSYPERNRPGGYDAYSSVLGHFIRDVREELSAPGLPFVIGVIGVGGPVEKYAPEQQRYKTVHQSFRSAMAAPAGLPEFRGKVAAVLTEECWDMELSDLVDRNQKIDRKVKEAQSGKKPGAKETRALREELRKKEFSQRELEILEKGVSNQAYHYLGSAKIMALIGAGFAEAMVEMTNEGETK